MTQKVIITFNDGRMPFVCPNHPRTIALQEKMNGDKIISIEPYDENTTRVMFVKPPEKINSKKTVKQKKLTLL